MIKRICRRCGLTFFTPFGYKICFDCRKDSRVEIIRGSVVHLRPTKKTMVERLTFIDYVRIKNVKLADKLKGMILYAKIS